MERRTLSPAVLRTLFVIRVFFVAFLFFLILLLGISMVHHRFFRGRWQSPNGTIGP